MFAVLSLFWVWIPFLVQVDTVTMLFKQICVYYVVRKFPPIKKLIFLCVSLGQVFMS